ncbi:phosphoserine phosphatase SerB [Kangiella sp. TOML190]|uniref:phosphoserine phosphatase SerB n=1 Tax=Kangiella sp. TOML190 TaxID=2931351 RepID=UPI00204208FD|nr:phosphoserine phosphatase SerB [Kangiella sp. TOML190]
MPFYLYLLGYHQADQEFIQTLLKVFPQLKIISQTSQKLQACDFIVLLQMDTKDQSPSQIKTSHSEWQAIKELLLNGPFDFIKSNYLLRLPKLVVFDMDSTLIPVEVIDRLAAKAGVESKVATITEAAMRGELDFNQSLIERVKLLKGLPQNSIGQIAQELTFNPGIVELCEYLLVAKAKLAIASGGFMPFAQQLQKSIPFAKIKANQLALNNQQLSGEVDGIIINAEEKAKALKLWTKEYALSPRQTMAVGDGANDLKMLQQAGLGIAYHAKPKVNQAADAVIQHGEINALVDLFEQLEQLN